jgi:N-acetylneuraminic acid mutarotase
MSSSNTLAQNIKKIMKRINITLFALMLLGILFSCTKASINYTQNGNWVARATWPGVQMGFGVCFVANNQAYVGLGINPLTPNQRLATFYKYTPSPLPSTATNVPTLYDSAYGTWTAVADFIGSARSNAVAFAVQNIGYVGSGVGNDGFTPLADFYSYNPGSNSWSQIDSIHDNNRSYPRFDAVAWGFDTVGYVLTGTDNNYYFSDVWKYSPATGHWSRKPYLVGNPRSGATAWVYHNRGYVLAGYTPGSRWAATNMCYDFWVFDPQKAETSDSTKAWTRLRDIYNTSPDVYDDGYTNIIRKYGAGFVMLGGPYGNSDDRAYITLGQNGTSVNYTWEYDFAQDLWYQKTPFEGSPRSGAVGFSFGNRGFVGTGLGTGNTSGFADLEEFFPTQIYNQYD